MNAALCILHCQKSLHGLIYSKNYFILTFAHLLFITVPTFLSLYKLFINLMFTFRISLAPIQDVHKNDKWELRHLLM